MKRFRPIAVTVCVLLAVSTAHATKRFPHGEIQARIAVQNTFQHDGAEEIDWVQERNELRFDLKYNLLSAGIFPEALFSDARFNLLWRGRYDAVFDLRDSYDRRGYDRDDFRFPEGRIPREVFLDLAFKGALENLSARIGRQQVVWGEADLFRSIDVINPLRVDQNGIVGEDFSDYREPLWIAKFLWNIGQIGPISEAGLEFLYSPDGRPFADRTNLIIGGTYRIHSDTNNVLDGFNRNTMLPFSQVRHPWEILRVGNAAIDAPATVPNADGTRSDFMYQISSDTSRTFFDVHRSMAGVRFLGAWEGIYFTLNYIYKRTDAGASGIVFNELYDRSMPGTGAIRPELLNAALAAAATPDLDGNGIPDGQDQQIRECIYERKPTLILTPALLGRTDVPFNGSVRSSLTDPALNTGATSTGCLTITRNHPFSHTIGMTATYNDINTGLVFRLEQSFTTKEPRTAVVPNNPTRIAEGTGVVGERDFRTNALRFTQVWRSMIGFDYLRSINPGLGRQLPQPFRSFLSDQWFFTMQFLNEYNAHVNGQVGLTTSFTDRVQHWNPLLTAGATGFFMGGRFRPNLAFAYEVNQNFPLFLTYMDFNLSQRLTLRVGEVLYLGSQQDQVNSLLNYYADRDTLFARVTYYLL